MRRLSKAVFLSLIAVFSASALSASAENFFQKTLDRAEFGQWSAQHQDWVRTHPDQYEFYTHHPEAAEQYRSEWADWRGDSHAFAQWASHHPEWVTTHNHQYEFFMRHPDQAEKYRSEWADWHGNQVQVHSDRIQFAEWAQHHPDWVTSHHDRYEFFLHHPEQAERARSEWFETHSNVETRVNNVRFTEWAASHPDWAERHHDRYEYFLAHPDQADLNRHEWYEEHHEEHH